MSVEEWTARINAAREINAARAYADAEYPEMRLAPENERLADVAETAFLAGAAFARMYAPTEDERETALREYVTPKARTPLDGRQMARAFRAGWDARAALRRSEVPEPSAEPPLRSAWHATPAVTSRRAEPQGEPSDALVLAALNARELSVRERSGSARHFNPAPDLSYYSEGNIADMRAALREALRAAAEVGR